MTKVNVADSHKDPAVRPLNNLPRPPIGHLRSRRFARPCHQFMEKPVQTSAQHVESGAQTRLGDGLQPAADDGGADKPPIPNASSIGKGTVLLNEKPIGARIQNTPLDTGNNSHDIDNVPTWAHTVPFEQVARLLGSNIQ